MEIMYELTKEDYISFNLHHQKNNPALIKDYKQQRNLLSFGLGFMLLLYVSYIFDSWIIGILTAAVFVVIFSLQFPKFYNKLIKKQVDRILQYGDNSSIFSKKTMRIDDEKIIVKSEAQTEILSKKYIMDIKIHKDMILIYTNGFTAHIIPTRYLISETKDQLLQELGINHFHHN